MNESRSPANVPISEASILLLSGAICAGKSTIGDELIARHGFRAIRSGTHLRNIASDQGIQPNRTVLQELGDGLDEATDFAWLVQDVAVPTVCAAPGHRRWLLDSVRKRRQVEHFRSAFAHVRHVHFTASEETLRYRFEQRQLAGCVVEAVSYDVAVAHCNEIESRSLGDIADLVIDSQSEGIDTALKCILALVTDAGDRRG